MIEPYTDDYKNLSWLIKYIQGTTVLPLVLYIYKSVTMMWYVDASFMVHKDKGSHTRGLMTMGTVGAYVQPRKTN